MKQRPNIPKIIPCKVCGEVGRLYEDFDFRDTWHIECPNLCLTLPDCLNVHRAVSRWNKINTKVEPK